MISQSTLVGPGSQTTSEGGRLDSTLRRVSDLAEDLQSGRLTSDPRLLLSELRVDWELHFALEEADAHFGVVLRERPSLSHEIVELKREHGALLAELEALRSQATDTEHWATLATPAAALMGRFVAHEHKEAELLQDFFLRDDGVGPD
jgi:hypothetical protein